MPRVSLCIPQYNRCDMLRVVIQDLLAQTYSDFELLICDDASTDQTPEIVSEFQDTRIRYVRNPSNLGLYPNFNRCVELAKGEYIAIYHNHDRYSPDIVARSIKLIDENPSVGYVHTGTISRLPHSHYDLSYVRGWPEIVDGKWFTHHLIKHWYSPVHQPTVMARKSMYNMVGGYDADTYGACADSAIWIKMSVLADVGYIALPLMRITPRTEIDYYGLFNWNDVQGMARAHRLGVELLREHIGIEKYNKEVKLLQKRHNQHFLLLLFQWISRGREDLISQGMRVIKQECSPHLIWIAQRSVILGGKIKPILAILAKIYGKYVRIKGRIEHMKGEQITHRYLND